MLCETLRDREGANMLDEHKAMKKGQIIKSGEVWRHREVSYHRENTNTIKEIF